MSKEQKALFAGLDAVFRKYPGSAIDQQTELVEMLSIMQVAFGDKPAFFANTDSRGRDHLFSDVLRLMEGYDVFTGIGSVNVHHSYRTMRVDDPAVLAVIAERSIDPVPIAWITRRASIAEAFRSGNTSHLDDAVLLGYPRCCAIWHYDCFFARGVEAFCEVERLDGRSSGDIRDFLRQDWRPRPGFVFPEAFFAAAVLEGNLHFPFVDHVACRNCRRVPNGPTARMDAEARALAEAVAPERVVRLLEWRKTLPGQIASLLHSPNKDIDEEIRRHVQRVRAQDAYRRHARHLLSTLDLRC